MTAGHPDETIECEPYRAWLTRAACGRRYRKGLTLHRTPKAGNEAKKHAMARASCGLCVDCPTGQENEKHGR